MRIIAMMSAAALALSFATGALAQGSQSAPQPGLPPGAAVGATNAPQPAATGDIGTTRVGPSASSYATTAPAPVRHTRRYYRRHHHRVAPVAPAQ